MVILCNNFLKLMKTPQCATFTWNSCLSFCTLQALKIHNFKFQISIKFVSALFKLHTLSGEQWKRLPLSLDVAPFENLLWKNKCFDSSLTRSRLQTNKYPKQNRINVFYQIYCFTRQQNKWCCLYACEKNCMQSRHFKWDQN